MAIIVRKNLGAICQFLSLWYIAPPFFNKIFSIPAWKSVGHKIDDNLFLFMRSYDTGVDMILSKVRATMIPVSSMFPGSTRTCSVNPYLNPRTRFKVLTSVGSHSG